MKEQRQLDNLLIPSEQGRRKRTGADVLQHLLNWTEQWLLEYL